MPAAVLIVLGLALMTGAEAHFNTVIMVIQMVVGLGVFCLGLAIGGSDLHDRAKVHREERNW